MHREREESTNPSSLELRVWGYTHAVEQRHLQVNKITSFWLWHVVLREAMWDSMVCYCVWLQQVLLYVAAGELEWESLFPSSPASHLTNIMAATALHAESQQASCCGLCSCIHTFTHWLYVFPYLHSLSGCPHTHRLVIPMTIFAEVYAIQYLDE